jgi:hypothetical protein
VEGRRGWRDEGLLYRTGGVGGGGGSSVVMLLYRILHLLGLSLANICVCTLGYKNSNNLVTLTRCCITKF